MYISQSPIVCKKKKKQSVPAKVLEVSKHQTPTSFYKQIDLNEAFNHARQAPALF